MFFMKTRGFTLVLMVFLILSWNAIAVAGVDKTEAQIAAQEGGWNGDSTQAQPAFFVDTNDNNKVKEWNTRSYHATGEATPALQHNKLVGGGFIQHRHHQAEFGSPGAPTAAQSDEYWNHRFLVAQLDPGSTSKKQHQTCHEWALSNCVNATGTYTYHLALGGVNAAFDDALAKRNDRANVAKNDILRYSVDNGGPHSMLVASVRGNGAGKSEPEVLRWKWMASGIYTYTTPNDGANEFNTPGCSGIEKENTPINQQGWVNKPDYTKNPDVWGPKP